MGEGGEMAEEVLSDLGMAALRYVELGFAVIPLHAREKKPAAKHGLNNWTDNPEQVRMWWGENPECNVGIVCGQVSHGLLVIDCDMDEASGKDGCATLDEWETTHGELPPTCCAVTGSGGMHYLYRTGQSVRPSANAKSAVDIRCEGSYIVAPPSVHPNGTRYRWEVAPWEREVADADANVMDFVDSMQRNGRVDDVTGAPDERRGFHLPELIVKGERDNVLFRYASQLREFGRSDEEIRLLVFAANQTRCDEPMPDEDVQRICRSVTRYERGESRDNDGSVHAPGRSSGGCGDRSEEFRTKRGGLRHNLLARSVMEESRACMLGGVPAVWTGERWDFGPGAINRACTARVDDIRQADQREVAHYIHDHAPHVSPNRDLDGRPYVQFANGTWDVLAGRFVEPTPEMFVCNRLPIELDVDAPRGMADEFLHGLADGDDATERAMREVIAACMCSMRVVSQSPMLVGHVDRAGGEASNGKSTYLNVLRALLGDLNVSALDVATLGQRFQAGHIVGKLANIGDDIPNGFLRGDELSTFKKMVTGDTIYTDVKGGDGYSFAPQATLVFSMNEVPRLADSSEGVMRRMFFVPFRRTFRPGDADSVPNMAKAMSTDENLRRLAVLGLFELPELFRRGAFSEIPDMAEEVASVRTSNDAVLRWMDEDEVSAAGIVGRTTADVYAEYKAWAKDAGERKALSKTTFIRRVNLTLGTKTKPGRTEAMKVAKVFSYTDATM